VGKTFPSLTQNPEAMKRDDIFKFLGIQNSLWHKYNMQSQKVNDKLGKIISSSLAKGPISQIYKELLQINKQKANPMVKRAKDIRRQLIENSNDSGL
jgi:hypothetical protein